MNSLGVRAESRRPARQSGSAIGQADMFGVLAEERSKSSNLCQLPAWPEQVVLDGERETLGCT